MQLEGNKNEYKKIKTPRGGAIHIQPPYPRYPPPAGKNKLNN